VSGAVALYVVYRLLRRVRAVRRLERRVRYRLLWRTGITRIGGILLSLYLVANIFVLTLLRDDLERWAGVVAAVNAIPLFHGGRTNIFIHYFGLNAHSVAHGIIGFVVIVEGLLHAGLALGRTQLQTSLWDYLVRTGASCAKGC
jgi:hypothetical protein